MEAYSGAIKLSPVLVREGRRKAVARIQEGNS